jgi:hypothetical protein
MRWLLRGYVVGLHDTRRTHEVQSRTYHIIASDDLANNKSHASEREWTPVPPSGCCCPKPKPISSHPGHLVLCTAEASCTRRTTGNVALLCRMQATITPPITAASLHRDTSTSA